MTAREISDVIAASVRASLVQVVESGQPLEQAIEFGVAKAIGNNAATVIAARLDEER